MLQEKFARICRNASLSQVERAQDMTCGVIPMWETSGKSLPVGKNAMKAQDARVHDTRVCYTLSGHD